MVVREKARAVLRPLVAAFVADRYADVATDGVQVVALAQELLRQAGLILFAKDYPSATMTDTAACGVWFEHTCDTLADAFEAHLARRRTDAGAPTMSLDQATQAAPDA